MPPVNNWKVRMIDTAQAKRLRYQAVHLVRTAGRPVGVVETNGRLRRIVQYERGGLGVEYVYPRDLNGLTTKAARPTDYTILIRFNRVKVFSMAWDKTRTAIFIFKPGNWQRYLSPAVPNVGLS
jgi:hypothetical protein